MGANGNSSNANFQHMNQVSPRNAHLIGDTDSHSEVAFQPGPDKSRWSTREKVLLACLAIILALAIALIVVVVLQNKPQNGQAAAHSRLDGDPPVCFTTECIKTAARMLDAMDQEVDPCDDFFEYACGTWNKMNIIPDDRSNYNTFGMLRDELQVILKGLLEVPVLKTDTQAITYAKNLYISCMNETLIEERGEAPLRHLLGELGGWPVLESAWPEAEFDLIDLLAKLRLYNNRILINQWVSSDDKDSSVNVIQVDQASLGMPSREYYLRGRADKQLVAYEILAREVALKLGADPDRAEREMRDMVDFEVELANITVPDADRRDTEALYNKMTLADLSTNVTDYIDWPRYMTLIFANISMTIDNSETVVVYAPEHLQNLAYLLRNTPRRTVANYLIWRIVINRLASMPQAYLDLRRDYNKALYGTNSDRARWRTCVNYVNSNFGMAVGRMFIQEHFNEKAKGTALEMIENIRVSFNELLSDVDWMDDATRKVAQLKADAIQEKIGYPDYILNDTALSIDYEGVNIDPDKYFENVLNNLNTVSRENLKNLRKPVDKTKWSTTPAVVNAFYSATKNQIMFPAGIFQPPFYKETYPKSINFGGIAVIIGHEITHGFDDKGRQFDKDGNLRQWWSEQVIERFKEKAQCIIDQYGNYTVPEINMNLNGKNTQGENIADNGGLKQAFRAYRSWVKKRGKEEELLPGLNLSNNQLFFLNFAQIWCGTARPESYIQAISSGRHSPGRFRVIGPLSNSEDFAEAYKCPLGSKMNPKKKCAVW